MVHVISMDGKELAPTNRHGKVRHLLREGRAKVVSKDPFTVQLTYPLASAPETDKTVSPAVQPI